MDPLYDTEPIILSKNWEPRYFTRMNDTIVTPEIDLNKIDEYFPMEEYRQGQREVIVKILESLKNGTRNILYEGPTGSGKSAIAYTIAQYFDSVYWVTNAKFLQDQLTTDFGEYGRYSQELKPMIDLKGRNAYPCNFWDRQLSDPEQKDKFKDMEMRMKYVELSSRKLGCDLGECKRQRKSKLDYCVNQKSNELYCPYFIRLYQAINSNICLMNFHSFLFQTSVVNQFGNRSLMIIDEAHMAEDALLGFIEIKISDRYLIGDKVVFPRLESAKEYVEYFDKINLQELITKRIEIAKSTMQTREEDEWKHMLLKLKWLKESNLDNWICIFEEVESGASRTVSLKPIFIDEFASKYLFSKADYVIMMSATILSKSAMCDALGLDKTTTKSFRSPCMFPKEIRPLYYRPCGSLSYKNKFDTMPKLIKEVEEVCRFHQNERGIIHTHNFEIANALMDFCSLDVKCRFIYQKNAQFNNNKTLMLDKHKESPNTILLAPAMHEGLDLKDELGRFQIICKVPYPPMNDPQIAARMQLSDEYYTWRTATKLIQSYGRIYRHNEDFGVTYVIDQDFKSFIKKSGDMIPKWFLDAIVWK